MRRRRTWKAAQLRSHEYRAWMIRLAGASFWLAIASLLFGDHLVTQLMLSTLVGATCAWYLAGVNARSAIELKERSERRRRGDFDGRD